ncbi:leucine-rich repeat and IQ domain-containing protein 1-like isoform X2 [Haliotis rubra]|uniref:leucine-rich repeat and IQ domain-containing protein 1-like isoform X2 n=1 Tax=Haliotis rubra TaxID=36100 RepID=UPI001EE5E646|nr:leucine-rich repeat and IQ domain-containing protein 1-like isoform X2 [Haliotis rubra]
MTMSPSGVKREMDEEAIIEAEIQQQLEVIDLDSDDPNNNIDDNSIERPVENLEDNIGDKLVLDEAHRYLSLLQQQTENFERELTECDDLITYHNQDNGAMKEVDLGDLEEEASRLGVDPAELRRKILEEIEREDEMVDVTDVDSTWETGQSDAPLFVTSEVELLTVKQDEGTDRVEEFDEQSSLKPGEGVVAVVDEIQTQEQFFKQQLQEMDMKYRQREAKWRQDTETRRRKEEERENVENEKRREIMLQYQQEEETLAQHKKIAAEKLEAEIEEKQKIISEEVKTFEEQITLLETETRREQQELERSVQLQQEKRDHSEKMAATAIQAGYRGYRVRKTSNSTLKQKREERAKLREEKRIQEVEEEIRQRKEEIKKKKIEELEEAKRQEEERIQREKEEKQRQEEIKKEEERIKFEEEKKKKEEEKRQEEEEKRQLELKIAEEERRKEENRKLEEERKEKERLEKERKDKERLEEERKIKERLDEERTEKERLEEEKKKKKEQEMLGKERLQKEEEQLRQEAEGKIFQEEKDKEDSNLNEENRLREENERLKEELRKVRGENQEEDSPKCPSETQLVEQVENIVVTEPRKEAEKLQVESKDTSSEVRKSLKEKREKFEESKQQSTCQSKSADTLGSTLPSHLEARRLAWIKECLPWSKVSNEPWKLKGGVSKKPPRRPSSAKKLPPLSEDVIIAAARVATLKQVTTVQLSDLPGCTLSTLSHCWGLKSLTLTSCNLLALDSLHECKQLQYLNVKRNKLEYVDLKDLGNLQVVNLSNNNLSLVHGLDGCTNIRWLDLSCNRITRLGCLDPLRRLHTLILSSNQLISCSGISDVPTLQHLNLSNNHLQRLDGLHKLCLLQRLDVSANNLLQFPDVRNQVLLEECDVSDNSISSLEGLTSCWLPLLTTLNLAKNSLTEVDVVDNLLLLRNLDISNNQLLDLEGLCSAFSYLPYLEGISVQDNPATDGVTYHEKFTKVFPRLKTLDGTTVTSRSGTTVLQPNTDFEAMCMTQCQYHTSVRNSFLLELQTVESKSQVDDLVLCDVYFRYCDKSFKMAVEHRYAHEYGEVSVTIPTAPTTPKSGRPQSARTKVLQKDADSYLSPKEMFEKALNCSNKKDEQTKQDVVHVYDNPRDLFEKALEARTVTGDGGAAAAAAAAKVHGGCDDAKKLFESSLRTETSQGMGNGKELFEKSLENQTTDQRTGLQSTAWPADAAESDLNLRASLQNLPADELAILEELHSAATKIQATWRGYNLRMKLSAALEYARREGDGDDSDLDDFNMDDLTFDEESLERGWRPTETPQIPRSHPVLGKPPIGHRGTPDVLKLELAPVHPPNRPRQAWRNTDSPLSELGPHPPRPPSSIRSLTDTHRTGLSKKEEKLAEEWGFHSSRTAELMIQRAKKMKLNSEKKKKLSKLDPKQRLALFHKLEETTKLSPIRPVVRRTLPRKEYFQAREDEIQRQEFVKRQEAKTRSVRTYEWLHTQVANFQEGPAERNSDLEGGHPAGRHTHMTSGYDDSQSVEERRCRRFSSGEGSGQTSFLPPIKSNSAGSTGSNGGRKKEKMSWRNKPTDVDVGWGGGRKRRN